MQAVRIAFALGLALFALVRAVADPVNTFYVDAAKGDDSYDGLCHDWDGFSCGPKASISAAVSAATAGDEIVVLRGTYTGELNRNIDIAAIDLTIRSEQPDNDECVANTIIDLNGSDSDPARAFRVVGGADSHVGVKGLTIQDGVALHGGALFLESGARVELGRCRLMHNQFMYQLGGGAVYVDTDAALGVRACTFDGNGRSENGAAAIFTMGDLTIEDSAFKNGVAKDWSILCNGVGNVVIRRTSFDSDKRVTVYWGTLYIADCTFNKSGGVEFGLATGEMRHCSFNAGGLLADNSYLRVYNCSLTDANAQFRFTNGTNAIVRDCLFARNQADGVVRVQDDSVVSVERCTFTKTTTNQYGSCVTAENSDVFVHDTICWDAGGSSEFRRYNSGTFLVAYSVVPKGKEGQWNNGEGFTWCEGNIKSDPKFVDAKKGDYHLQSTSPCRDSGDPTSMPDGEEDVDGEARVMGGRIDMGFDEYTGREFVAGDANCDGARNFEDIDAFVVALIGRDLYESQYDCDWLNADANGDGGVDFRDIDGFVTLLIDETCG